MVSSCLKTKTHAGNEWQLNTIGSGLRHARSESSPCITALVRWGNYRFIEYQAGKQSEAACHWYSLQKAQTAYEIYASRVAQKDSGPQYDACGHTRMIQCSTQMKGKRGERKKILTRRKWNYPHLGCSCNAPKMEALLLLPVLKIVDKYFMSFFDGMTSNSDEYEISTN